MLLFAWVLLDLTFCRFVREDVLGYILTRFVGFVPAIVESGSEEDNEPGAPGAEEEVCSFSTAVDHYSDMHIPGK